MRCVLPQVLLVNLFSYPPCRLVTANAQSFCLLADSTLCTLAVIVCYRLFTRNAVHLLAGWPWYGALISFSAVD